MKKLLIIGALVFPMYIYAENIPCDSAKAISGDTFICKTKDDKEITLSLYQTMAPKKGQPYYNESKKELSQQLISYIHRRPELATYSGRGIRVYQNKAGKAQVYSYYFRGGATIDYIPLESDKDKDVAKELIKQGLAWYYPADGENPEYEQAQQEAKKNKAGLWADDNPTPPWKIK